MEHNANSIENGGTTFTSYSHSVKKGGMACLESALFGSSLLICVAICVSSLCFGISGAVFLGEEYTNIPDCASSFRGWGIAMTTLFILASENVRKSASSRTYESFSFRSFGAAMVIMSFIPGLIAGLGNRDVLQAHDGCDRSDIPQLITWTKWIIVYNIVLFSLMVIGGAVLMCSGE